MVALVEGDNPSSGDSGLDGPFEFRGPEVRSRDVFDRLDSALRWDETIRRDAQSGGGGCFPGGIDSAGRQATHVREQLAFSDSGISDHQHVQVPRILRPSGITFGTPLNSWRARASFSTC